MKPVKGKFYLRFMDESLEKAVSYHSVGFNSVDDAVEEAKALEDKSEIRFEVYDSSLSLVYEGKTTVSF